MATRGETVRWLSIGVSLVLGACDAQQLAKSGSPQEKVAVTKSALTASPPSGTWVPIGPAPIDTTIAYTATQSQTNAPSCTSPAKQSDFNFPTSKGGQVGRATVVAVDPLNSSDVWLGTANGGVWYSSDAQSAPFRPMTDSQPSLAIGSILPDGCNTGVPPDGATRCTTVYAGTGENSLRRDTYYGAGILRGTWTILEFPTRHGIYEWDVIPGSEAFKFGSVASLVKIGTKLYASVSAGNTATMAGAQVRAPTPVAGYGIHRWDSTSGTWTAVLPTLASSTASWTSLNVPTDLEADPSHLGGLLAGVMNQGIFRSDPTNDTSWCSLNPGATLGTIPACTATGLPAAGTFDHVEIAVTPGSDTLYAMFGNCPAGFASECNRLSTLYPCVSSIYRSTNQGVMWTQVQAPMPPTAPTPAREGYSRYTHLLKTAPGSPDELYYGGLKLWHSTDGGQSWGQLAPQFIHPDHHDVAVIPGAGLGGQPLLYAATDGGIYESLNGGMFSWISLNHNLLIAEPYGIGVGHTSDSGTAVLGGFQDDGVALFNGSRVWPFQISGDGGDAIVQDANVQYFSTQNDSTSGSIRRSDTRSSTTVLPLDNVLTVATKDRSFQPILVQHEVSKRLYTATDVVAVREGSDAAWAAVMSPAVPAATLISPILDAATHDEIALESDRNIITALGVGPSDQQLYAGLYEGQLWRSTVAGGTLPCPTTTAGVPDCWARADTGLPTKEISSIAIDPANSNRLWVAISGFGVDTLWFSDNGGASWSPRTSGLEPGDPAKVVRVDPRDATAQTLFLGTDHGLYLTTDGGLSWAKYTPDVNRLPNAPVFDVEVDPIRNRVFAATHGRGVWMLTSTPQLTTFEGWTSMGIWDIPVYGEGFLCFDASAPCSCTIEILRENGSSCAPPTNVDARGSHIQVPSFGSRLSTDDQQTTCGKDCDGLPVVWACFNSQCAGGRTLDQCNGLAPLPGQSQPDGFRVSGVRVSCAGGPAVQTAVAGAAPQQAQPPSDLFQITAADSVLANGTNDPTVTLTPTLLVAPPTGMDRPLCSVPVSFTPGESVETVQTRIRDAINANLVCSGQGVSAALVADAAGNTEDADQAPDFRLRLRAPGLVGNQLVLAATVPPGAGSSVCFEQSNLGDYAKNQAGIEQILFTTATSGAAGGTVFVGEISPAGRCGFTATTTAGETAQQIAAAVAGAFQAAGAPSPDMCPRFENARDIVLDEHVLESIVTVVATKLEVCINDPGVGVVLRPHGVDLGLYSWTMFRREPLHEARSAVIGAQTNALRWTFSAGGLPVRSSPAVAPDGTVYVGGRSQYLYAINPNGTQKWRFRAGGLVDSAPAVADDGTVYVGGGDGKLYAIDPAAGSARWATRLSLLGIESSPVIGTDGTIYIGSPDGKLYAVSPAGAVLWSFNTGLQIESSPAIGGDGTVYVGSDNDKVYAVNPNGTLRWSFRTGADVESSPALSADGRTLYVGSWDHKVYALSSATGALLWSRLTGDEVESSPAVALDGTIYVGSADRKLYALNPTTGAVKWTFPTSGEVASSPAVGGDGTVYVGSDDKKLYALDPATGAQKWSRLTSGFVRSSPAIGLDGTVYFGSDDGKLYAVGH